MMSTKQASEITSSISAIPTKRRRRYELGLDSEKFSETLGRRADHVLKQKAWIKSVNGPGWHDVEYKRHVKFGTFARAQRFPTSRAMGIPGPGIYGKEHIPHAALEEKSKAKGFSFSDAPSFEYDNCMPRSSSIYRSYHLPPNLYKLKASIDELKKVTSKRGPYDLFTGTRDETSLYGHFAKPVDKSKHKTFSFPGGVQCLNNRHNKFKGQFSKCGRETYPSIRLVLTSPALCKPDPDKPAPNSYDPHFPPKPANAVGYGFNSSSLYVRPIYKIELKAPPGRYDPKHSKRIIGDGMRSAFLSKIKRGIPLPEKMSWY